MLDDGRCSHRNIDPSLHEDLSDVQARPPVFEGSQLLQSSLICYALDQVIFLGNLFYILCPSMALEVLLLPLCV